MGDSSVSSDSVGDRSISPTRSDEPAPEPAQPPRPPSPVLVSKLLAEEAVAKRNSRLLMNQKSAEATALGIAQPTDEETIAKPATNGSVKAAPVRMGAKKRMAPAPPSAAPVPPCAASTTPSAGVNGMAKVSITLQLTLMHN